MRESQRVFAGTVLLSVAVAVLRHQELAGDPVIYQSRMALLFDGESPYFDFFFEHLPFAIIPMAVPWLLGGAFNTVLYTALFASSMAACLYLTLTLMARLGGRLGIAQAEMRWLAMAGALFPIVLFRYDPVPVLLAAIAALAVVEGRDQVSMRASLVGVLTKGWLAVFALIEWWRGRRWRATSLAVVAIVSFALLAALPGFSRARAFSGIHSETLLGGLMTMGRLRSGSSLQLIGDAGATYVAVPTWAVILNLAVGVLVLGLALHSARGEFTWAKGVRLLGAATLAILIGSPLLSPQFLLWPTPFLALHPHPAVRRLAIGVSVLTLAYMLGWNPGFEGDLWWVGVMNLRNLVLVVLGVATAVTVTARQTGSVDTRNT